MYTRPCSCHATDACPESTKRRNADPSIRISAFASVPRTGTSAMSAAIIGTARMASPSPETMAAVPIDNRTAIDRRPPATLTPVKRIAHEP